MKENGKMLFDVSIEANQKYMYPPPTASNQIKRQLIAGHYSEKIWICVFVWY
jgi:hypothetical protein